MICHIAGIFRPLPGTRHFKLNRGHFCVAGLRVAWTNMPASCAPAASCNGGDTQAQKKPAGAAHQRVSVGVVDGCRDSTADECAEGRAHLRRGRARVSTVGGVYLRQHAAQASLPGQAHDLRERRSWQGRSGPPAACNCNGNWDARSAPLSVSAHCALPRFGPADS